MPDKYEVRFEVTDPKICKALEAALAAKGNMAVTTYGRMVIAERLISDGFLSTQTNEAG